jgi:Fe-S-cluster containining protein
MSGNPFEALIKRLNLVEAVRGLYQQAQNELEARIGIPVCMPNCGQCCETVMVWGIEVESIASSLVGQERLLNDVMDRCEAWLAKRNGHIYSPKQLAENTPVLLERAHELMTGRCPLLSEDLKCLIYQERPLSCRAFGVTSYPRRCPRPCGLGESGSTRAYNQGMAPVIKEALKQLLVHCSEDRFSVTTGFLPTLLMSRLRAQRFAGMVDSGKVDPVKLVRGYMTSPTILSQDQAAGLSLAGDEALQEVEREAIQTGPIIVKVN